MGNGEMGNGHVDPHPQQLIACQISLIFSVGKQHFIEFRQWDRFPHFIEYFFANAVWASASGGFRNVSDTLVNYANIMGEGALL